MDKITNTKTEFRLKQWTKIVETRQASGMTVVAWCNQNNVNTKSYYYWLRKLRIVACEAGELPARRDEQPIVPLTFAQATVSEGTAITIHLPSVSIDIKDGTSQTTIEAVLAALKNIC
ncbi:MAG: IS66 family insertion sequence element accessory protein TnpA [Clostridia bacterium]